MPPIVLDLGDLSLSPYSHIAPHPVGERYAEKQSYSQAIWAGAEEETVPKDSGTTSRRRGDSLNNVGPAVCSEIVISCPSTPPPTP